MEPVDPARDHLLGSGPVTLVEYGDFECPYCADAAPSVQKALAAFAGRVTFVFRHFPVVEKHPHAEHAAEAAEAAGAQGEFFAMHDRLFAHRTELEDDELAAHAGALGLDADRVAAELRDGVHAERVRADRTEGEAAGVQGTPAFFIDGEPYGGFYDVESLGWALEDAGA